MRCCQHSLEGYQPTRAVAYIVCLLQRSCSMGDGMQYEKQAGSLGQSDEHVRTALLLRCSWSQAREPGKAFCEQGSPPHKPAVEHGMQAASHSRVLGHNPWSCVLRSQGQARAEGAQSEQAPASNSANSTAVTIAAHGAQSAEEQAPQSAALCAVSGPGDAVHSPAGMTALASATQALEQPRSEDSTGMRMRLWHCDTHWKQ